MSRCAAQEQSRCFTTQYEGDCHAAETVALVTGANQGIGLQIAGDLVAHGFTVLVGSRDFERGKTAARDVGPDATP
ncbi:SDR family NAD(P)-dependent oxidoreductase [Paraburkholderia sp. BCC1884]|uniref:SDR family NAD(P)-dependent oxidoreductase n=1 Tax=Paraburkholderia sp. BCC1884 TaxID=2562668 RepID=UPI001C90E1A9